MTHRKLFLSFALVAVAVGAAVLTGWTFSNFRESHSALGEFDVRFLSIERGDDLPDFVVTLSFENEAEATTTTVEFMGLGVYYQNQLIVSTYWFPEDFEIPPRGAVEELFNLESNLQYMDLSALTDDEDRWEARMRFRITHPVREGTFLVDMRRNVMNADVWLPR